MTPTVLSERDRAQIEAHGLTIEEVERQLRLLAAPPQYTRIDRPCRPGDGVRQLDDEYQEKLIDRWQTAARAGRVSKFVPASGAASRMFRDLQAALDDPTAVRHEAAQLLLEMMPRFAFVDELAAALRRRGHDLERLRMSGDARPVLETLLQGDGLGYGDRPKGLLAFHRDPDGAVRTAFEEHLHEAVDLTADARGEGRVHFTVSPEHEAGFRRELAGAGQRVESARSVRLDVTFSHQSPSTDTVAAHADGGPLRLGNGALLFRPGGHGALLHNLQSLADTGADLVLVKNIDNVVPERDRPFVSRWKRVITGLLVELEARAHGYRSALRGARAGEDMLFRETFAFVADELAVPVSRRRLEAPRVEQRAFLLDRLARPIRVASVVRNEGEPGGGPFWAFDPDDEITPQIIESSQLDANDPAQREAWASATHFNPVDLALSLRGPEGEANDLTRRVDERTYFVSRKSHEGRDLLALERPGLWNGAMAGWNTVFVEVPAQTFAPVKTVFDLLRPAHHVDRDSE